MIKNKLLLFFFIVCSILFLLFSYTQVDLSLTLSSQNIIQTIQKSFQWVGFYNRPWAAGLYLGVVCSLFLLYGVTLHKAWNKKITFTEVWTIIIVVGIIFSLSYPASLSYDIFNYIFTAKTILLYGQNPYIVKPLDFSGVDSMLSFMRWTHLPSAYPPFWIFLTLPFYLLSFHSLFLSLYSMRLLTTGAYFLCVFLLSKINSEKDNKFTLIQIILFGLNPLVLLEGVASGHNDIVMMAFALSAVFLGNKKYKYVSFLMLAISVATKFMTIFLIPAFFFKWNRLVLLAGISMGLIIVLFRREFLPWYFLWIIPFSALLPKQKLIQWLSTGISFGLLLRYIPVLYYGSYDPPVSTFQLVVFFIPIIIFFLLSVLFGFKPKHSV